MKKILLLALVMLVSFSMLFAQGSKEAASSDGKTVITWWAFPTFADNGATEKALIEAFEAANPDVKVNLETIDFTSGPQKLTAAIEGGAAPDVLFDAPGRIIEYGANGRLVNLDSLFTKEYLADIGGLANACTDGNHYYMYPLSSAPFWMSINKEMWEKAGAWQYVNTEGDRLWTTENWAKAMEALGKAGYIGCNVYCGGQGGDQGTRALVNNLYSSTIYKDGKWTANTDGNKKALELLVGLYKNGAIDFGRGIAAADELQLYQQEMIASTLCWGTSNAKNYKSDSYTQFSVP
ncbi:MAG: extracellular solute-binding protein, partial [Spirochaetales bacterium]|nr:extracellular solute-binding protein [Spirochaetales bacterium]